VKLTFYERKLQRQEAEKFEEWRNNRPLERILEIGEDRYIVQVVQVETNSKLTEN
jgi:hypothetical protein